MRICVIFCKLLAFATLYCHFPHAQSNGDEEGKDSGGNSRARHMPKDYKIIEDLRQIHLNQSAIMFWRPQKVGSSTVLSLLTSYGYRYNAPPRRKTPLINSLCIKMARCALSQIDSPENRKLLGSNAAELRTYLEGYIKYRSFPPPRSGIPTLRPGTALAESICESQSYKISSSHQICNLRSDAIRSSMQCTFSNATIGGVTEEITDTNAHSDVVDYTTTVKELFVVRNPLSRAISVYYFWGELFKMHRVIKRRTNLRGVDKRARKDRILISDEVDQYDYYSDQLASLEESQDEVNDDIEARRLTAEQNEVVRLGMAGDGLVKGSLFTYHGNETSVPPFEIAMAFAQNLPYKAGMPGPSFTWSVFASNVETAVEEINSDRIMSVVTERLDESLVVASHYFGWSLADVVVTAARKALSSHPKHSQWPVPAVTKMESTLKKWGEYDVYNAANTRLDERIDALTRKGVDFAKELRTLKELQKRVTKLCMSEKYLVTYRDKLKQEGYPQHTSNNKLRDSAEKFNKEGHCFSFNSEIMYSYDICGNCEAHAMLFAIESGLASSVDTAPTLADLDRKLIANNPNFAKCP